MALQSTKKHKFVKAWMNEHVNDHWVKEATRRGYRSRAAFKLIELAERDKLLRPGMSAVDLGSAPGSWSQVLREKLGRQGTIVALDVLDMDPLPGVTFLKGDFREDDALADLDESACRPARWTLCYRIFRPICRASNPSTRRARCIWASWPSSSRRIGCGPGAIW